MYDLTLLQTLLVPVWVGTYGENVYHTVGYNHETTVIGENKNP